MGAQLDLDTTVLASPPSTFGDDGHLQPEPWFRDEDEDTLPGFYSRSAAQSVDLIRRSRGPWLRLTELGRSESTSHLELVVVDLSASRKARARADDVSVENVPGNVFELRRLTGFKGDDLADLLDVTRRTLTNWINGSEVRTANADHIAQTLKVLRYADRGTTKENQRALQGSGSGLAPLELIKQRRYGDARSALGAGPGRASTRKVHTSDWAGGFQPLLVHPDADGSEVIGPMPYVAEPEGEEIELDIE